MFIGSQTWLGLWPFVQGKCSQDGKHCWVSVISAPTTSAPISADSIIKLPSNIVTKGRPKGSGNTVIGLKRKQSTIHAVPPKKIKFSDKSYYEQGNVIVQWLTSYPLSKFGRKKITDDAVTKDPMVYQRIRSNSIDLSCIEAHFASKTYKSILDKVRSLEKKMNHTFVLNALKN